jgi:hypothetical protein
MLGELVYSTNTFEKMLNNTTKGATAYSKYALIKNAKNSVYLALIKDYKINRDYCAAARFAEEMGNHDKAKIIMLRELRHKEKIGDYYRAIDAAKWLNMKSKARRLVSKNIDERIRKTKAYNKACLSRDNMLCLDYDSIISDCKKYHLEKKLPIIREAQIEDLIITGREWKAISVCKELGMIDKAREIKLKQLNKLEMHGDYIWAVSICKELGLDERLPELYEKSIEQAININDDKKFYSAYKIAKEAGLTKKAKELALQSINEDKMNSDEILRLYEEIGMSKEAEVFKKLHSFKKN